VNTANIDEAIERYVCERKRSEKKTAEGKFLSYAYLACGERDTVTFMKKTRGLIKYYIDYLSVLENPLRGPQAGWLALMSLVFFFGVFMLTDDDMLVAGIFITSGTLVNGISLARAVIAKWVETAVMIAFYQEIVDLIDRSVPKEV
jgi:hypothetical protein